MARKTTGIPAGALDLDDVRELAGEMFYERGVAYYHQGRVSDLAEYEGRITARVHGTIAYRVEIDRALDMLREGGTLAVWRLDRLGRSLRHLIELVGDLEKRGVAFRSLQESIDTTTSGGKLIFHVFGALAAGEGDL